jgi:hypothetical protein
MLAQTKYTNVPTGGGTNVNDMLKTMNLFVSGKGGWYSLVYGSTTNFTTHVAADVADGWSMPTGVRVNNVYPSLPGYPPNRYVDHWISTTSYAYDVEYIYYVDPIHRSPAPELSAFNVPGPMTTTETWNLVRFITSYIW